RRRIDPGRVGPRPGGTRRAAVDLLRGGRVRGRVAVPVLADRAVGVPGRRADDRPEAVRDAGRYLRPPLRGPVRADHVCGRRAGRRACRGGVPVNRQAQALLLFLIGAAVLRASAPNLYLRYAKAGLRPPLPAAALLLIGAAAAGAPYLTRMVLSCCAADALPVKVGLAGQVPPGLASDTWLEVTGTYVDKQIKDVVNDAPIPFIEVSQAHRVPAPADPYQS